MKEALAALFLWQRNRAFVLQMEKIIVATMMPEMHQIHFQHEEEYLLRGTALLFSACNLIQHIVSLFCAQVLPRSSAHSPFFTKTGDCDIWRVTLQSICHLKYLGILMFVSLPSVHEHTTQFCGVTKYIILLISTKL